MKPEEVMYETTLEDHEEPSDGVPDGTLPIPSFMTVISNSC